MSVLLRSFGLDVRQVLSTRSCAFFSQVKSLNSCGSLIPLKSLEFTSWLEKRRLCLIWSVGMLAVYSVIAPGCSVTNIDSCECVFSAVKPFDMFILELRGAERRSWRGSNRQKQSDRERNRDIVNQMWSERNQNPPTGTPAKLLVSLYGKIKLPQNAWDCFGS